jgi:hypothetical protein
MYSVFASGFDAYMILAAVFSQIMVCFNIVQVNMIVDVIQGFEGYPLRKDFPLTVPYLYPGSIDGRMLTVFVYRGTQKSGMMKRRNVSYTSPSN